MKQLRDVILSLLRSRKFFLFFFVFSLCFVVSTIALFVGKMSGETWLGTQGLISGLVISYGVINVKQKKDAGQFQFTGQGGGNGRDIQGS